jgi:dTDP-4-dehydrorhamnose reductase
MKVLLTGASGLLGTWMLRTTPSDIDVISTRHETPVVGSAVDVDLVDADAVARTIRNVSPDLVVHLAYRMDRQSIVDATSNLVATGRPLVLASTDAVFPGDGRVWAESDEPAPVWDYGRWKVEAERVVGVRSGCSVRLPLMCSLEPPDGTTASILSAARSGERIGWYRGEVRCPAWAEDVAAAIWRVVEFEDRSGVWHLMGAESLTRAELGRRLAALAGVDDPGVEVDGPPAWVRPRSLLLSDDRARVSIGWSPVPICGR